jgi:hypothetical protein
MYEFDALYITPILFRIFGLLTRLLWTVEDIIRLYRHIGVHLYLNFPLFAQLLHHIDRTVGAGRELLSKHPPVLLTMA